MALSELQKWYISFLSAAAFVLVSLPEVRAFLARVVRGSAAVGRGACRLPWSTRLVHGLLFAVVVRLLMFVPIRSAIR
jgi:hypothetical protein